MLSPLYEKNKIWTIECFPNKDGSYSIKTTHGQINGKMIEHIVSVKEGKNIGKKNETSIKEQAELEVKRDWDKKIKQGYSIHMNTESTIIKPMLAIEYKTPIEYPVWVQPKLDGVRCLIYLNNNEVVFQSRQNTIYEPFEHLIDDVKSILLKMPSNTILDGELYTHNLGFEQIVSMVRKAKIRHPDILKLKYTLYDCFNKNNLNLLYEERLKLIHSAYNNEKTVELIETKRVLNETILNSMLDYYCSKNYEGIMIRNNGQYKAGARSKDLLKYKKFLDQEFEVVGHHLSKMGVPTPIFECKTKDGKTFSVMMKEDVISKQKRLDNIAQYYGKMLTVKYQELTTDGIPRFPVGISFRDYE
jgi:DNA ligase-1